MNEEELQEGTTVSTTESGVTVNVTYPDADTYSVVTVEPLSEGDPSEDLASTMASVIEGVLGEYHREIYTVTEYDSEGNVIATSTQYVDGLAGLDYAWISGAMIFGLCIAGLFKLLGGLIRS